MESSPAVVASWFVDLGFVAMALVVAALVIAAVRAAAPARTGLAVALVLGWAGLFSVAAATGLLRRFDLRPPPFAFAFVSFLAGGVVLGRSALGAAVARRLPLWALVAFHAFRLPLELVMHQAAAEGVMPPEMTFGGLNYDIVTGVAAIVVAVAIGRGVAGRGLASAFAVLSGALLAAIIVVALIASPLVRGFGPPPHVNSFVAGFPFVLLPSVCVTAAIAGQVVLMRRLRAEAPALAPA